MIKYAFYIIYNVIYQIVSFWFLLYLGVYFNGTFIPNSLMRKNNKHRTDLVGLAGAATIQASILLIEAAVLILLIYFINKLILSDTEGKDSRNAIAKRTVKINIIASFCFIAIPIWGSF